MLNGAKIIVSSKYINSGSVWASPKQLKCPCQLIYECIIKTCLQSDLSKNTFNSFFVQDTKFSSFYLLPKNHKRLGDQLFRIAAVLLKKNPFINFRLTFASTCLENQIVHSG